MKKIHLIEAITDWFASDLAGDMKSVVHPEIVRTHLGNVFNTLIYNAWVNGKKFGEFSQLDVWSKTYEVTVQDQTGQRAFCFLPFAPVQLPDGMGIRQVRSHREWPVFGQAIGEEWTFVPIEATANAIFDELEVSDMDDMPTYRLEQNSFSTGEGEKSHMLWLEKLPLDPLIATVDILMVQNLSQMGDYDEIICPAGGEDILVRQVIEIMTKKQKPDTLNDMNAQQNIQ